METCRPVGKRERKASRAGTTAWERNGASDCETEMVTMARPELAWSTEPATDVEHDDREAQDERLVEAEDWELHATWRDTRVRAGIILLGAAALVGGVVLVGSLVPDGHQAPIPHKPVTRSASPVAAPTPSPQAAPTITMTPPPRVIAPAPTSVIETAPSMPVAAPTTPPRYSDGDGEPPLNGPGEFVAQIHTQRGWATSADSDVLDTGRTACHLLDSGWTPEGVAEEMVRESVQPGKSGLSTILGAQMFTKFSVYDLCPRYTYEVPLGWMHD